MSASRRVQGLKNGGVKPMPATPERMVLTDSVAHRLAKAALAIHRHFGGTQDIEWAVVGETVYILQARPYVAR